MAMCRTWRSESYRLAAIAACLTIIHVMPSRAEIALHDSTGRPVAITDTSRIVSVGGAVTEILYALGKDKSIVGIDTTSLYPRNAAAEKPNVGYMRQLSPEGVLGLKPSAIFAIEGSGPKDTLGVLQSAGVPLVVIPDSFDGDGIVEKVRTVALAAGEKRRGECIVDHVNADLAALKKAELGIAKPKRVMFVLSFVNGKAMVAGNRTAANGIIRMAGAENAITAYDGYKQISDEAVIEARPDVVLSMERGGPGTLTSDAVFANPAFAATPAAVHHAFIAVDGLYMLGFGPRTARAARDLALALYPELKTNGPDTQTSSPTTCAE